MVEFRKAPERSFEAGTFLSEAWEQTAAAVEGARDALVSVAGSWAPPAVAFVLIVLCLAVLRRALRRIRGAVRTSRCRWKRDPRRRGVTLTRWQCIECGVEAFTSDRRPPRDCKKELREIPL